MRYEARDLSLYYTTWAVCLYVRTLVELKHEDWSPVLTTEPLAPPQDVFSQTVTVFGEVGEGRTETLAVASLVTSATDARRHVMSFLTELCVTVNTCIV